MKKSGSASGSGGLGLGFFGDMLGLKMNSPKPTDMR